MAGEWPGDVPLFRTTKSAANSKLSYLQVKTQAAIKGCLLPFGAGFGPFYVPTSDKCLLEGWPGPYQSGSGSERPGWTGQSANNILG